MEGYVGLIRKDGREPWDVPGYKRVKCEICPEGEPAPVQEMVLFDPVEKPGYGIIDSWAIFSQETGGEVIRVVPCRVKLDAFAGTLPFIRAGELYMGIDVSSQVKIALMNLCGAGGM